MSLNALGRGGMEIMLALSLFWPRIMLHVVNSSIGFEREEERQREMTRRDFALSIGIHYPLPTSFI